MPIVGIICIVVFLPWDGIWAWITPLPDTVQEQVDDAIGHGLDGIIVYVIPLQKGYRPSSKWQKFNIIGACSEKTPNTNSPH